METISFKLWVRISWKWRLVSAQRWMLHPMIAFQSSHKRNHSFTSVSPIKEASQQKQKASSLQLAERFCDLKSSTIFQRHSAFCHQCFTPYYPHAALQAHAWGHTLFYYWGERARWKTKHSHFIAGLQPDGVCPLCPKRHTGDVRFPAFNFGNQLKVMTVSDKGLFSKRVTGGLRLSSLQLSI